ncbi:MAG TPA: polysaccharide deacetylase, partial [Polyangiaceae bacterium]|nr:polysaccharide deacetylase [Polyangiaceae bacterium]
MRRPTGFTLFAWLSGSIVCGCASSNGAGSGLGGTGGTGGAASAGRAGASAASSGSSGTVGTFGGGGAEAGAGPAGSGNSGGTSAGGTSSGGAGIGGATGTSEPSGMPIPNASGVAKPAGTPGNLTILNWAGFKAAVSFTFDDALSSQISNYAALQGTGAHLTFYLVSNNNAASATWSQAAKDGHEL